MLNLKKNIVSVLTLIALSTGAYAQYCYTPNWTEPSLDSMLIYVSAATLNGSNLQAGDAIGVFDGDECVGLGVLTQELTGGTVYLLIEVSRDNPATALVDGFTPGNTISYRFCEGGNIVNPAVIPNYVTNGPDFVSNDSCIVQLSAINTSPVFSSMPDTLATEDLLYASGVMATDIDGDEIIYSAPVLPPWLLFDADAQTLSGTPANDDVGTHEVTLSISDGTVSVDSSFTIRVQNANDAPTFILMPDTLATQDVPYASAVAATDIDGDTLSYSAPEVPLWLSFDTVSLILSGTPTNSEVGTHDVTLSIFDGTVSVDSSFTIRVENVNDAPVFLSTPDLVTLEDALYSYAVLAEDIDGDTLRYDAPVIPLWLSFDTVSLILSGTPLNEHVGEHNVVLTINDGTEEVVQDFTLEVLNTNDPPVVTSTPVTEARPGVAYTYTIIAEDEDGDALTYTARTLPGWLNFNPVTHTLSATPGEGDIGDQFVIIRISDGSLYVDHTFVITVSTTNHAPYFTSEPKTTIKVGDSYVYALIAQDIDGDVLSYSAPVLPDWLTFYDATNVISGIPQNVDIGQHDVTVSVSDGTVSAEQKFRIHVEGINNAPTFTSTPETSVMAGDLYVYYATAEDADGDELTFSAPVLPDWLNFDASMHAIYGTPGNKDARDHNVTLRVSDGEASEDQNFVITVEYVIGIRDFLSPDLLLVYPNPSSGMFHIELSQELDTEIRLEIMDPIGRTLQQRIFPSYSPIHEAYDLSGRSPGIYFIRIYDESSQIIKKLILR